ncbi:MAG: hypothetical protein ACXVBW_02710, partial [Bdellovibrionota bacterium]
MSRALLLLLFLTVGFEALAQARDRTPFADAGEDGYTLVLWGDQHPDAELEKIFVRIRESGAR